MKQLAQRGHQAIEALRLRQGTAALLMSMVLAFLLQSGMPAYSQSGVISQEAYWQKVEQTRSWLQADHPAEEWESKAREWEAVKSVSLPDGRIVPIDTEQITAMLRKKPANAKAAAEFISALEQAKERWNQTGDKTAELERLANILARSEFSGQPENPLQRLLRRIQETLLEWLEKLFPSGSSGQIPFLPPGVIVFLAVALLLGVLAYVFRDTWQNILREVDLTEEESPEEEILSAQQATRRAQQLSGSGDYRQAVRYLYLSALLLLDERGLLRYNRTQTNREYLRQVAGSPRLAGHLRVVVETFDRVWYGFQAIDETEYSRYAKQVGTLDQVGTINQVGTIKQVDTVEETRE